MPVTFLVGVTGFEPAASTSQTSRATNCATPRSVKILDFSVEFCKWSNLWSSLYLKNNFSSANMLKTQHLQGFSAIWCLVEQGGGNLLPKLARYQLRHTSLCEKHRIQKDSCEPSINESHNDITSRYYSRYRPICQVCSAIFDRQKIRNPIYPLRPES